MRAIQMPVLVLAALFFCAGTPAADYDPPGTNLVLIPLGGYSNSVPWYLPAGTNAPAATNNPMGWEAFHCANNNWLWASNRLGLLATTNVLSLAPLSVSSATNTTWGRGAGLLCVDTNYVYVSVGTNVWKRVGLTNW